MKAKTDSTAESATVAPFGLADLLDPRNVAGIADFSRFAQAWSRSTDHAGTYGSDMAEVSTLNAKSAQKAMAALHEQQISAVSAAGELAARVQPNDLYAYLIDAWQRAVLFVDVMRQRGNNFVRHEEAGCPPVLAYDYEVVIDGTQLDIPVNYSLVAIKPPPGDTVRQNSRPYIIIDPRAGHGSGIGGFKSESEVGVALHAGHPVYFCVFTTHPMPGQTLAHVTRAEAHFVREVQRRHPDSSKPVVIGNCQGGWAAMVLAATNPDLTGPVVVNGAPLSYWSGTRGKNPLRYMGGLSGGVVPAMIASDLGNGHFDGANLVLNFESLNPAATWWKKYYDVFAGIDTESERYLEFERWWSGFYFMNEAEIRWIVENLFVGNRFAHGGPQLDSRLHVDLRNLRAPVIVFASHGDNITPPGQALNWITDVYASVKEIKARGQRIVYTVHDSIGHLGIFVSAQVANKQHKEIVSTLKAIESMAPGLYEMIIVEESGEGRDKHFTIAFEERTIKDILALDDGRNDEQAFAAVSRLSRLGAEMYSLTARPFVQAMSNAATARMLSEAHPLRASRNLMSDRNPVMAPVVGMADAVRRHRQEASPDNPYRQLEKLAAELSTSWLQTARGMYDGLLETWFYAIYSSPLMRALGDSEPPRISQVPGTDLRAVGEVRQALAQITRGNYPVGFIRMLVLLARSRKSVRRDRLERANDLLTTREPFASLGEAARTRIIHQQTLIVEFEPEQSLATLPLLIPDAHDRAEALELCAYVAGSVDDTTDESRWMFDRIKSLLAVPPSGANVRPPRERSQARRKRSPRTRSAKR